MASVLLSPVGNGQQFFDNNGVPLAGGLIYTYQAGSSTLLSTYTTSSGNIANTNPIVLDAYGRTPNEIWMLAGYSYKLVIQTAGAVTLQTLDNLYPILQNASAATSPFVAGMIIIWSGSLGSIPSGWVLCNGSNGTPDLRDKFVVAAGSTYAIGATGGSADAVLPSHTHTLTDPGHAHASPTISTGGSFGTQSAASVGNAESYVGGGPSSVSNTTGITIATTGVSPTNANLPPYYALAYIMKT